MLINISHLNVLSSLPSPPPPLCFSSLSLSHTNTHECTHTHAHSQVQHESGRSLLQKPTSGSGEMISNGPEVCWAATDLATASIWIWDSMIWPPPEHMMLKVAVIGLLCGSGTDVVDEGAAGEMSKSPSKEISLLLWQNCTGHSIPCHDRKTWTCHKMLIGNTHTHTHTHTEEEIPFSLSHAHTGHNTHTTTHNMQRYTANTLTSHIHTHICTHSFSLSHTHMLLYPSIHTHTHTNKHTHTHKHTYTHIHMLSLIHTFSLSHKHTRTRPNSNFCLNQTTGLGRKAAAVFYHRCSKTYLSWP